MSNFDNTLECGPTFSDDSELQKLTSDLILCEKYQLKKEAGVGGMGVVWKAWDKVGERWVALKFVPPEIRHSDGAMEQVKTAFKMIQALNHQNIGPVYGLEKDDTFGYFIVKKWLEGKPLSKVKLPPEQIPKVLAKVAAALDYAHSKRVMHRDVKPSNIYIETNGDVYLIDFGIAAEIQNSITNNTSSAVCRTSGTRPYMAPEQWRSLHQDGQTDQYALAVVAYQLYSGHLPFQNSDLALLRMAILQDPPEQIKNASPAVNAAIQRALSKDRKARFGSCREFIEAFTKKAPAKTEPETPHPTVSPLPQKAPEISSEKKGNGKWLFAGFLVLLAFLFYSFGGFEKKAGKRMVLKAEGIEYAFRWCPPGEFKMGTPKEETANGSYYRSRTPDDDMEHTVKLSKGFWMMETEVTQEMWESVMGENPSKFEGKLNPVENVSWEECQEFCQKLSQKLEQKVQLPTEAQWEYACRAGSTDGLAGDINLLGWYGDNSDRTTHPVRQKMPNAWGLYDMHGNVCEWCSDYYYEKYYESSPDTDPENTAVFPSHVKRGGCWKYESSSCQSAHRGDEKYTAEVQWAEEAAAPAEEAAAPAAEEAAPWAEDPAAPAAEEAAPWPAAAVPAVKNGWATDDASTRTFADYVYAQEAAPAAEWAPAPSKKSVRTDDKNDHIGFRCCLIPAL